MLNILQLESLKPTKKFSPKKLMIRFQKKKSLIATQCLKKKSDMLISNLGLRMVLFLYGNPEHMLRKNSICDCSQSNQLP